MAKNNNNYKKNKSKDTVKAYKNPAKTIWGKVIIGFLALAMALTGLLSLLLVLLN